MLTNLNYKLRNESFYQDRGLKIRCIYEQKTKLTPGVNKPSTNILVSNKDGHEIRSKQLMITVQSQNFKRKIQCDVL